MNSAVDSAARKAVEDHKKALLGEYIRWKLAGLGTVPLDKKAFGKLAKIQPHEQHWTIAIDIRTGQRANALDFHDGLASQLHVRQRCQFSCQQRR